MITKTIGLLLMLSSLTMLPPIGISILYQDHNAVAFLAPFFITLILGNVLWLAQRHHQYELKSRDGFLIVMLFWLVLSLAGSIPFLINPSVNISFTDAFFESTSGFTTTGASVLEKIAVLPPSLSYYRQQMHLLGGMGIIVLAVAVLPMLGIGGMQLYRAETPGPMKESKLTPRITETAKALWSIYASLVILCILALWVVGMPLFNAIGESFSIVATGGFSMHASSFAYYNSYPIDLIATLFMFLGSTNFALHFRFFQRHNPIATYWHDDEFRLFVGILLIGIILAISYLFIYHYFQNTSQYLVQSLFSVVALSTTTGLTTTQFHYWPSFLPYMIMFLAIIGGCGGSTTGGIKVVRLLILRRQSAREIKRLIHPRAVYTLKLGNQPLPDATIHAVWAFVSVFLGLFILILLLLLAFGLNFTSAFGATVASLANAGAPIGTLAEGFHHANAFIKWVLIFSMFAGRFEIFTVLVLLTPEFWRR